MVGWPSRRSIRVLVLTASMGCSTSVCGRTIAVALGIVRRISTVTFTLTQGLGRLRVCLAIHLIGRVHIIVRALTLVLSGPNALL